MLMRGGYRNQQEETNEKFFRSLREMEEQSCKAKRNSGMSCREHCASWGTEKCLHPEKVFPNKS